MSDRHKKARIIRREEPWGEVWFVIQTRGFLFRWWTDAWFSTGQMDKFKTLDEARANLCRFDGSPTIETVVG